MKKQFTGYMSLIITVSVIMGTFTVMAGDKVEKVKPETVKLSNIKNLSALEAKLSTELREASDDLFKVLSAIRTETLRVKKNNPEIKKLNDKIAKLQIEIDKITLSKSKDMFQLSKKRDALLAQNDNLREELMAVRAKKVTLLNNSKTNINK